MPERESNGDSAGQLTPGVELLHYKIIKRLGGGGMGEVYLAQDQNLERRVALKTLSYKLFALPRFRNRFRNEAKSAARLNHKNICSVYAIEETKGQLFIAMEYIEGVTLKDLAAERRLDLARVREIICQCCEGLNAAHIEGVVHRDIKSSNIMIDKYGNAKILDFGLAKLTTDESATQTSSIVGTYLYMSPEQITGQGADHRSDIFSLGVVLYETITGDLPFKGDNVAAIAYAIAHNEIPPIGSYKDANLGNLSTVISKSMNKDPDARYQTASEMAADLVGVYEPAKAINLPRPAATAALAILPFRNLTSDPENRYMSEGICEDVITAITKLKQVRVASYSAVKRLIKRDFDPVEISEELGVTHLVEGSIRRQGDLIRMSVQMTRASDESVVWSDSYERKTGDLFSLQNDISMQIAAALNITLTGSEIEFATEVQAVDPDAYELYLQGKYHLRRRDEPSLRKSVTLLGEAVELDTRFAAAYGELAVALSLSGVYGYRVPDNIKITAQECASRAIDLDPAASQSHMSMYFVLRYEDIRRAISELRTAIALDKSNSEALHYLAHTLMFCGEYKAALDAELAASQIDPFMEMSDATLCRLYYFTGRKDDIISQVEAMSRKYGESHNLLSTKGWLAWCNRSWKEAYRNYAQALKAEPSDTLLIDHLADCMIRLNDPESAITLLKQGLEDNPNSSMLLARLGQAYSRAGNDDLSRMSFDEAEKGFTGPDIGSAVRDSAHNHHQLAWLFALKDDADEALRFLNLAVKRGYGHFAELRARPDWDALRENYQFQQIITDLQARQ